MSSLFGQLVRKLPGSIPFLSRCRQTHSSSIVKIVTRMDLPFTPNDDSLARLVGKNIIPLTDILPKSNILDRTNPNILTKIDMPVLPRKIDIEPRQSTLDDPNTAVEKRAHVMLRIKRKKMNRHKYEKRQRLKRFQYMRIKRIRYAKKENQFRGEIAMKLKELEKFDPAEYVNSRLEKYRQVVLPNRIRGGVRMPPFVVIECLEKRKKRRQEKNAAEERRRKFMAENGDRIVAKYWKFCRIIFPKENIHDSHTCDYVLYNARHCFVGVFETANDVLHECFIVYPEL